jgi:hypothetical protein
LREPFSPTEVLDDTAMQRRLRDAAEVHRSVIDVISRRQRCIHVDSAAGTR